MKKPTKKQILLGGLVLAAGVAMATCDNDPKPKPKPEPKKCECPNEFDHWEDESCCTNNDGAKTDDCDCHSVAKANGTHIEYTERYDGEHDDCYVMFNGAPTKRKGDNCVVIEGQRPEPVVPCECTTTEHDGACMTECPGKGIDPCDCLDVIREFEDITYFGKDIKLIDETGNAQNLKTRGIWQAIQDGCDATTIKPGIARDKFFAVHATGDFAIVITSGTDYPEGFGADGYKVVFHENTISEWSAEDIGDGICTIVWTDMTIAKANARNTVRLTKAPVDVKAFAAQVVVYAWCQSPNFRSAVRRHDALYVA